MSCELQETVGRCKHKGKNYAIWLTSVDGAPDSWSVELPAGTKYARRFSDLMNWLQRHQARIDYTSLRPDIGELDRRINAR